MGKCEGVCGSQTYYYVHFAVVQRQAPLDIAEGNILSINQWTQQPSLDVWEDQNFGRVNLRQRCPQHFVTSIEPSKHLFELPTAVILLVRAQPLNHP